MIRSQHIKEDMEILDKAIKEDKATLANVVKAITLGVKLLMDIRSNQVAIMEKSGIVLRTKPKGDAKSSKA